MDSEAYLPLLGMGAGLLQASQPRGGRQTFAGALGQGLLGGLQGYQMQQEMGDSRRQRRLQELQLQLASVRAQKQMAEDTAQQMAFGQATEGMDPKKAALLRAGGPQAMSAYVASQFPQEITPYQSASLDLSRDQMEQQAEMQRLQMAASQGNQAAQLEMERRRLAIAERAASATSAPDYMTVRDPNDPNESIYLDKRTGQPLMQNGQPVRPASSREAGAPFANAKDLRKSFEDLTKDPREIVTSYSKIDAGFKEDSGPGDIAGIFGYMKLLDPTSVVREGEFATAENSAGVGESIRNLYNKVKSGERLTPKARQELLSAARSQLGPYKKRYEDTAKTYTGLANSFNVDPSTVVTPLEFPDFSAPPAPAAPPPYTPMVPGAGPVGDAPAAPVAGAAPFMPRPAAAAQPQQPVDEFDLVFGLGAP